MISNDAAYLAGVIDGEGHLSLTRKQLPQCRWPTFGARLGISNTDKAWLEGFQREIGGWIRQVGKPIGNRKPCYVLNLEGVLVIKALELVQPFLKLKQQRAVMLMRFFDLAERRRSEAQAWKASSPEIIAELDALYLEQKRLNWRGTGTTAAPRNLPRGRLCGVEGCQKLHFGRGYCHAHYKKYVVRGGPKRHENTCQGCQTSFVSKRDDAEFCSTRCRVRHHRLSPHIAV